MPGRCAAVVLLALLAGACAPPPTPDERDRLIETFCTLYFEQADLMAALPWVDGAARVVLLDEMRALPRGATTAPRPRGHCKVVQRQELPGAGALQVRLEFRIAPLPGSAPDAGAWIRPFILVVENLSTPDRPVWRITTLARG